MNSLYKLPLRTILGVVVITFLALCVRLIGFPESPVSLYWDEMAIWNDAQSIIATGRDLHNRQWWQPLFISYGDYKLPIFIWLVAVFHALGFGMFSAVRLPSLLAGVSMVPALWLLTHFLERLSIEPGNKTSLVVSTTKRLRWLPWVSAGIVAVLPWSLHFSHVGFEGHVSASFLLWSMVAVMASFTWSLQENPERWKSLIMVVVSVILGSLAVYTYFSTRFVWPIVFFAAFVLWGKVDIRRWSMALLAGLLWGASLLPLYQADFYQASNQFRLSTSNILAVSERPLEINVWRERSGNTLLSRVIANKYTFIARDFAQNIFAHLDPDFLIWQGDDNLRHGNGQVGILYPVLFPFLLIGSIALLSQRRLIWIWLILWWLVALVPASVPTDVPHALRSLNALPPLTLVTAYGIFFACQWWISFTESRNWRWLSFFLPAGVGVALVMSTVSWTYTWTKIYPQISADEWQDGYLQLAEYIAQERMGRTTIYVDSFDERFFLYYQPLSGLSWQEIQTLESKNFARSRFENVVIGDIDDWGFLHENSLVVTKRDRVAKDFMVKESIVGKSGKEYFVVVEIPKIQ